MKREGGKERGRDIESGLRGIDRWSEEAGWMR